MTNIRYGTVLKRPIMCYIFEKQALWGYQILYWKVCLGHHLGHVWGMPGACLGQHLGHIVNNGQQSEVLHASVMPLFCHQWISNSSFCFRDMTIRIFCDGAGVGEEELRILVFGKRQTGGSTNRILSRLFSTQIDEQIFPFHFSRTIWILKGLSFTNSTQWINPLDKVLGWKLVPF